MFEYQKPVTIKKRFSLYNEGSSFNDKTYTMAPMKYIDAKEYIENNGMTDISILPSNSNDIQVKIAKVCLDTNSDNNSANNYGYYIQCITINPNYGRNLIRLINSEPFVHYICDYIISTNAKSSAIPLPSFLLTLSRQSPNNSKINPNYHPITSPTEAISIFMNKTMLNTIDENVPDSQSSYVPLKYRNFDFYNFNGTWMDGEVAVQSKYIKIIEDYFDSICYHYKEEDNISNTVEHTSFVTPTVVSASSNVSSNYVSCTIAPVSLYSEETYELKTVAALSIGKVMGRQDLVNDLLGRIYAFPHIQKLDETFTTEIMYMYEHYINSVGHHIAEVSNFRPEVALNDYTYTEVETVAGEHTDTFISKSIQHTRNVVHAPYMLNFVDTYKQRSYFKPLSEQINLLREAALNFLPTDIVTYTHTSYRDCIRDIAESMRKDPFKDKIFHANIHNKNFFNITILGTSEMNTPQMREKILNALKKSREFVVNQYNFNNVTIPPKEIISRARGKMMLDIPRKDRGDTFLTVPVKNMPVVQISVDLKRLKQLFFSELPMTRKGNINLSSTTSVFNNLTNQNKETYQWCLPDDWRKYQEVNLKLNPSIRLNDSIDQIKVDRDTNLIYHQDDEVFFTNPLSCTDNFKSFTFSDAKDPYHRAYYGYDPAMNIRESMRLNVQNASKSASTQQSQILSFYQTSSYTDQSSSPTLQLPPTSLYPINTYTTVKPINSDELVIPMFGAFACITVDEDLPSIQIDTLQEILAQPSQIFNIIEERRY